MIKLTKAFFFHLSRLVFGLKTAKLRILMLARQKLASVFLNGTTTDANCLAEAEKSTVLAATGFFCGKKKEEGEDEP